MAGMGRRGFQAALQAAMFRQYTIAGIGIGAGTGARHNTASVYSGTRSLILALTDTVPTRWGFSLLIHLYSPDHACPPQHQRATHTHARTHAIP